MAPARRISLAQLVTSLSVILTFSASVRTVSSYRVVHGDTLWDISGRYGVSLHAVIDANPQINNPNAIYPGEEITIPGPGWSQPHNSDTRAIINLVNQERARYGLSPLKENPELSRVATLKAQDMANNGYFAHVSPTYGDNQNLIQQNGIGGHVAENLAGGQTNDRSAFNSWMASPTHRDNILKGKYSEIGVGFAKGGPYGYYWVQMFVFH